MPILGDHAVCADFLERRDGRYFIRRRVPADLIPVLGKKVIRQALRTADPVQARVLVREKACELDCLFAAQRDVGNENQRCRTAMPKSADNEVTVQEATERFKQDRRHHWSRKTEIEYELGLSMFVEFMGRRRLADISRQDCRDYQAFVRQLPSNFKKHPNTRKLKLSEIPKAAKSMELPLLSDKSVGKYMAMVSAFFSWADRETLVDKNPSKGLAGIAKRTTQEIELKSGRPQRRPFRNDELIQYFRTVISSDGRPVNNSMFWVPAISLFNGLRLNECCQLNICDISEENKVWIIKITDSGQNQKLKTASSNRIVPIHTRLLRFGLIEYIQQMLFLGSARLFPDIPIGHSGFYSDVFSKRFGRNLRKLGFNTIETPFHSFRHCFRDGLRAAEVPTPIARTLGGWVDNSVSEQYGTTYPISILMKHLNNVTFEIGVNEK